MCRSHSDFQGRKYIRSFSVLSFISKTFETLMPKQISDYIHELYLLNYAIAREMLLHSLHYSDQYQTKCGNKGFRETVLMNMSNNKP